MLAALNNSSVSSRKNKTVDLRRISRFATKLTFLSFINQVKLVAGNAEYDVQLIRTGSSLLYLSFPASSNGAACGSSGIRFATVNTRNKHRVFRY